MARDISFGHQGRFTDRGYEAQLNRASALSLIINAIVVWNTRHFDRAQTRLSEQGYSVDEAVWQHLSPLAWKHINLVGSYHFAEVQLTEEFRPHREVERSRPRREGSLAEGGKTAEKEKPFQESFAATDGESAVQLSWL